MLTLIFGNTVYVHLYVETSFGVLFSLKSWVIDRSQTILPLYAHLSDGHDNHLDDVQSLFNCSTEKVTKVQLDKVLEFSIDAAPSKQDCIYENG